MRGFAHGDDLKPAALVGDARDLLPVAEQDRIVVGGKGA
jgi:hypothetical protein